MFKNSSKSYKRHAIGIIIIGCLAMYFSNCISTDALNVLAPIFAKKGISYSLVTLPSTIATYALIVGSFLFSTIIIKKGTRIFTVIAFASMAISTFMVALSYQDTGIKYSMYFAGQLIARMGCVALQMAIMQICAEWFEGIRGKVLGIITIAAPLNSATSVAILTFLSNVLGFRSAYIILGLVLTAATVLTFFFDQTRPSDMGMTVDGLPVDETKEQETSEKAKLTAKQILTNASTWKLMLTFALFTAILVGIMVFFTVRMQGVGISTNVALAILSGSTLIGIPLSYFYGWIDDKFGTLIADRILALIYIVTCICLLFGSADRMFFIIIGAVGIGSMTGGTPNLHPSSIMHVFGTREYQNANRYIGIGVQAIGGLSAQILSLILDKTGSLDMGYVLLMICAIIATILIWTTKKVDVDKLVSEMPAERNRGLW